MRSRIAWAVFVLLASVSLSASADGTAAVSFTGVHFQLIDLAPDDGIAPALTFSGPNGGSQASAGASTDSEGAVGAHAFDPLSVTAGPLDGFGGTAAISGDLFAGTLGMRAGGFSSSTLVGSGGGGNAVLYFDNVAGLPNLPFTLSPHTRLVISGDATGTATASNDIGDYVSGEVFLGLTDSLADAIAGINTDDDIMVVAAGLDATGNPNLGSARRELSVSFENAGDDPRTGLFTAAVYAGSSTLSDVPEPASGVLMLAATALLGAMRRRSRGPAAARAQCTSTGYVPRILKKPHTLRSSSSALRTCSWSGWPAMST
jgi:hypothetical protein